MLAAPKRDNCAEHGEPEKQDRGEFVRPNDWIAEDVARDHADKENDDLKRREDRDRPLNEMSEPGIEPRRRHGQRGGGRRRLPFRDLHGGARRRRQAILPVYFSSTAQASSPYLPCHSL